MSHPVPMTTILTYTGTYLDFANLRTKDIDILDIAHGLANTCRFSGQCRKFYSVAQHSVIVSKHVGFGAGPIVGLWGLLHDAAEAYIGDIPSPAKRSLDSYKSLEDDVLACIARRFNLSWPMPENIATVVKHSDVMTLETEKSDIMGCSDDWNLCAPRIGKKIIPESRAVAKRRFLERFDYLEEKR